MYTLTHFLQPPKIIGIFRHIGYVVPLVRDHHQNLIHCFTGLMNMFLEVFVIDMMRYEATVAFPLSSFLFGPASSMLPSITHLVTIDVPFFFSSDHMAEKIVIF